MKKMAAVRMTVVRTVELDDDALDFAVAQALGARWEMDSYVSGGGAQDFLVVEGRRYSWRNGDKDNLFSPSSRWDLTGPLLEREKLFPQWSALWGQWETPNPRHAAFGVLGTTPMVSALRALVIGKLGDEVSVPSALLKNDCTRTRRASP